MGYAHTREPAAESLNLVGFKNQDVSSGEVEGAELDRADYGKDTLLDEVDITIQWEDQESSGGAEEATPHKTATLSVTVDDDDNEKTRVVTLPVDLVGSERYGRGTVQVAAGTGSPTVSAATASLVYKVYPGSRAPDSNYDRDGYVTS
jgi:hypothetical protein